MSVYNVLIDTMTEQQAKDALKKLLEEYQRVFTLLARGLSHDERVKVLGELLASVTITVTREKIGEALEQSGLFVEALRSSLNSGGVPE